MCVLVHIKNVIARYDLTFRKRFTTLHPKIISSVRFNIYCNVIVVANNVQTKFH